MVIWALGVAAAAEPSTWVDIDNRLLSKQSAPEDTAVVIGLEDYLAPGVPDVPFARRDAEAFYSFLLYTRGIPMSRIRLLKEGNREQILEAVREAAERTHGGTLWFYFAGHGAAGPNSGERLLLGDDARTDSASFEARSVPVAEITRAAAGRKLMLVLDVCYTGYGRGGAQLGTGRLAVPQQKRGAEAGRVEWTATEASQIAFPLKTPRHGAFTYFAIGAMRGWADGEFGTPDGKVTGDEAQAYVRRALAKVQDQPQSPEWIGQGDDWVLSANVGEAGPPLEASAPVIPKFEQPKLVIQPEVKPVDPSQLALLMPSLEKKPDPPAPVKPEVVASVVTAPQAAMKQDPDRFRADATVAWAETWRSWSNAVSQDDEYDSDAYRRREGILAAYVDRWYDPEVPVPEVDIARAALNVRRYDARHYRTPSSYARVVKQSRSWGKFPLSVLVGAQASGFGGLGYGAATSGVGGGGLRLSAVVIDKPVSVGLAAEGTFGVGGPAAWGDLDLQFGEELRWFVGVGGGVQGLTSSPTPLAREVLGLELAIPVGRREPETGCLMITGSLAQHQVFAAAGLGHATQASIAVGWAASPWPHSF